MGWKESAGSRPAPRRSVVFITNDAPPRFICTLGNPPTCVSQARRCSGHDDRQLNCPEAIDRSGYWHCTLTRKQHPGGTTARNIAYHRHFRLANDRSHSRALSQVRLFDRGFADTPFSYQQCSSSPEHCRKSEEKTILAAVSFFKVSGTSEMCQKRSWVVPMASDLVCGRFAFFGLAAVAAGGLVLPFAAVPETKPQTAAAR